MSLPPFDDYDERRSASILATKGWHPKFNDPSIKGLEKLFMSQLSLPFLSVISPEAKLLARRLMISDGLLPTVDAQPDEIQEALGKLSPEARKRTTRRFRKAWRRAREKQLLELRGSPAPSTQDKQELVLRWYLEKAQKLVEYGQ